MIKPNFLIIGSPKSGTTSLYKYLSQHPDIEFSDIKEPKFFCLKDLTLNFKGNDKVLEQIKKSTVQDPKVYSSLFKNKKAKHIGEASADYFHMPDSAQNIFEFNPNMKLILILRNPIDRAYSDWKHNVRMGYEPIKSFKKAIDLIDYRKLNRSVPYFDYLGKGNYSTHLKEYLTYFKAENILILFFEDFKKDANIVCNQTLKFLGVEGDFLFDTNQVYMKNDYTPKYYRVHRLAKKAGKLSSAVEEILKKANALPYRIPARQKAFLKKYYKEEVLELEGILKKYLRNWLDQ